uniref:Transposase Tc1-like domain-containing protein n=1 Tax=Esox lucius TaxID=8010 RepID=A0AAY5K308_ESOLU
MGPELCQNREADLSASERQYKHHRRFFSKTHSKRKLGNGEYLPRDAHLPKLYLRAKAMAHQGKYDTTGTLPRTGRPSKIDEKMRRKLVREASKRPTATLKELQEFQARTGYVLHVTTISLILHMNGLWERVARRKPFLSKKNIQARLKFAKTNIKSDKSKWENVLWSDESVTQVINTVTPLAGMLNQESESEVKNTR